MKIKRATGQAVRFACKNYHYAKRYPVSNYSYSIYTDENEWCGVIIFGYGAGSHISKPFNLFQGEVLELVRVALNGKQNCTSQAVALALKQLKKDNPKIKCVVSYADLEQNHKGIIYQATNWIYLGLATVGATQSIVVNGNHYHARSVSKKFGNAQIEYLKKHIDKNAKRIKSKGKHKYLFCFDKKMRKKYLKKAKPYPK